jgi:hypothetical protein
MSHRTSDEIFHDICNKCRPSEAELRQLCKEGPDEQLREVLRCDTRDSLDNHDRQLFQEEIESRRHRELSTRIEELKKPHWTLVPTFGLVLLGVIAGIVAAVMEVLAWER